MAQTYDVLNANGGVVLPTANGTFYTGDMNEDYEECQVYIEFFSDSAGKTLATATAGTVTVTGSPMGNIFLAASNLTTINASEVSLGTYTPAEMSGCMVKGKIAFAGVTGADYARVQFWRA